jgi:hypothetical protein
MSVALWFGPRSPIRVMSALPPIATLLGLDAMSALGQKRTSRLLDHLIGRGEQRLRNGQAEPTKYELIVNLKTAKTWQGLFCSSICRFAICGC